MKALVILAALGVTLPAFGAETHYTIDSSHTYPSLEMSHMGISVFRGKFNKTTGTVTLDREAKAGTVDVQVDTASLDFGNEKMDAGSQEKDWLDVATYPTMTYKGKLTFSGDTPNGVDGALTLRGVTKPLKLRIESFKCIQHPMRKKEVCGADAHGEFNRADFGLTKISEGPLGVIRVEIQVEANKDD
ncbi:MAG: YceI family protein [Rhodanobacteraceae bacterium]